MVVLEKGDEILNVFRYGKPGGTWCRVFGKNSLSVFKLEFLEDGRYSLRGEIVLIDKKDLDIKEGR